jgi:hypothetical protein
VAFDLDRLLHRRQRTVDERIGWIHRQAPGFVVPAALVPLAKHDRRLALGSGEPQRVLERPAEGLRFGRRLPLGERRIERPREHHPAVRIENVEPVVADAGGSDGGLRAVGPRQRFHDDPIEAVGLDSGTARLVEVHAPGVNRLLRLRRGEGEQDEGGGGSDAHAGIMRR